jgi:hypothetical protein
VPGAQDPGQGVIEVEWGSTATIVIRSASPSSAAGEVFEAALANGHPGTWQGARSQRLHARIGVDPGDAREVRG